MTITEEAMAVAVAIIITRVTGNMQIIIIIIIMITLGVEIETGKETGMTITIIPTIIIPIENIITVIEEIAMTEMIAMIEIEATWIEVTEAGTGTISIITITITTGKTPSTIEIIISKMLDKQMPPIDIL